MASEYLYRLQPIRPGMLTEGPTPAETDAIAGHLDYLKQAVAAGQVLLAGRTVTTAEKTFGLVVLRAEDEAAARCLMAGDPVVSAGIMRAELFPFRVCLLAPAWPAD
jgi:uncharacterized protein YciI